MFWYNGQVIEGEMLNLTIKDPGLLYGATIFTTLRVYDSLEHPLTHWQAHCDRLRQSLQAFGWSQPNWQRLHQGAEMLSHYPVLRITLFADGREWVTGRFLPEDVETRQQQGITARLAEAQFCRSLPEHKTGNYLGTRQRCSRHRT